MAQERARKNGGTLILRNDDLDRARCKSEFVRAMLEDLKWFGFEWTEGPDIGGPLSPYNQSERSSFYRAALETLREAGLIYPCDCSRRDIQSASQAPHAADDEEPIYPGTCRGKAEVAGAKFSWRFRVRDGEAITFVDGNLGERTFVAGKDFGDFVVWRNDDVPTYQLACVVDDAAMEITEVVRGEDLLLSTARQLLLYRGLGLKVPAFFHCPLILDENGQRLAKRSEGLSLRTLRGRGAGAGELRKNWLAGV
jgi:glutamyl-tRNA synthetase